MLIEVVLTKRFRSRATMRRSWNLLRAVQDEQSDPESFYHLLACDTLNLVSDLWYEAHHRSLRGCCVVDVGSGPGYFAQPFSQAGVTYIGVDSSKKEMRTAGLVFPGCPGLFVQASGLALPFADNSVDIVLCSNVAEHVAHPFSLGEELLRISRPHGLVIFSYTVWLGPFGGHETGWRHYFGGRYAAQWYTRRWGHRPKNDYGVSLFPLSVRQGLQWARHTGALQAVFPRYHPRWVWPVTTIPVISEFVVSNVVFVLQKDSSRCGKGSWSSMG